jgi:hypothetical protein
LPTLEQIMGLLPGDRVVRLQMLERDHREALAALEGASPSAGITLRRRRHERALKRIDYVARAAGITF